MRSLLVAVLVMAAAPAHADPDDLVTRPLVLPAGSFELRVTGEIAVQYAGPTRLLSLAPDAWFGLARRWSIGVIHSNPSVDRIAAGASLCVDDSVRTPCDRLYRNGGLEVRYSALEGPLAVAPRARALVRDLDPVKPAVTLGALVRWARGRFAITSDPYLRLPLANRTLGNRAALFVPIWFAVQPVRGWMLALHTGYDADLAVALDGAHIPVGLGVTARVTCQLDFSVEAGWSQLLGPQIDAKHASLLVTLGWRR